MGLWGEEGRRESGLKREPFFLFHLLRRDCGLAAGGPEPTASLQIPRGSSGSRREKDGIARFDLYCLTNGPILTQGCLGHVSSRVCVMYSTSSLLMNLGYFLSFALHTEP